jgi:hypothetical protein
MSDAAIANGPAAPRKTRVDAHGDKRPMRGVHAKTRSHDEEPRKVANDSTSTKTSNAGTTNTVNPPARSTPEAAAAATAPHTAAASATPKAIPRRATPHATTLAAATATAPANHRASAVIPISTKKRINFHSRSGVRHFNNATDAERPTSRSASRNVHTARAAVACNESHPDHGRLLNRVPAYQPATMSNDAAIANRRPMGQRFRARSSRENDVGFLPDHDADPQSRRAGSE